MSGSGYTDNEFYNDSAYTADISTKMRVPDRLLAHNGHPPGDEPTWGETNNVFSVSSMQVPDRILIAGGEQHIHGKSTPRELQLENSVMPPTPEHVRVQTPPRSIRMSDVFFPTVQDEPFCPTPLDYRRSIKLDDAPFPCASDTPEQPAFSPPKYYKSEKVNLKERTLSFEPDNSMNQANDSMNLSLYDEVQRMRTQIAKLNHRLMSAELENQQQNQRWQMCSILVSTYFLAKILVWMNRN